MALRLAKGGWWNGDPGLIMKAPCDEVMAALRYEGFLSEYEGAVVDLNRDNRA